MAYTHIAAHNVADPVRLSLAPTLAATAVVRDCRFGRYTQVGEQSRMEDCLLDDYAYLGNYCDLMSTDIGKFANIASMASLVSFPLFISYSASKAAAHSITQAARAMLKAQGTQVFGSRLR